jgi:hypothetical protein
MSWLFKKLGDWVAGGLIGAFIGVVATTIFQKGVDRVRDEFWLWISPETISFESTKVSGCSGGEIRALVQAGERQGLPSDSQLSNSFLCASWQGSGATRHVLESIAARFDRCFKIDKSFTTPRIVLNAVNTAICRANLQLDKNNQWKTSKEPIYLCLADGPNTPNIEQCAPEVLISLGFTN